MFVWVWLYWCHGDTGKNEVGVSHRVGGFSSLIRYFMQLNLKLIQI